MKQATNNQHIRYLLTIQHYIENYLLKLQWELNVFLIFAKITN